MDANENNTSFETVVDQNLSLIDRTSFISLHLAWFVPISAVLWSVSVVGNASVLLCVVRDKKLHRPSYYLVAALSLADISFPLFCFAPMTYGAFVRDSTATCNPLFKFIIILPTNIAGTASYLTLICLQIERYWSLAFPISHRRMVTKRRALFVATSAWVLSVASTFVVYPSSETASTTVTPNCSIMSFEFGIMIDILGFSGVLFLSLMNCHFIILLHRRFSRRAEAKKLGNNLRVRSHQVRDLQETSQDVDRSIRSNDHHGPVLGTQASKSVAIVVIFFILCWLHLALICTLETISHRREVDRAVIDASRRISILLLLNGAINPVVYARKNPHLRAAFRKLIKKTNNQINEISLGSKIPPNTRLNMEHPNVGHPTSGNMQRSSSATVAVSSGQQVTAPPILNPKAQNWIIASNATN